MATTIKNEAKNYSSNSSKMWLLFVASILVASNLQISQGFKATEEDDEPFQVSEILAPPSTLFRKDAVEDVAELEGLSDCHLRNLDLCYAGLMSGGARVSLPENNADLEFLCDEIRVAATCAAAFNQRCLGMEVLETLAPMLGQMQRQFNSLQATSANITGIQVQPAIATICDPKLKGTPENKAAREELFALSRCLKARLPAMRPCIDDLRAAIQVFYEPTRSLPVRPTCCALARFRKCAEEALDGVCGLSSFQRLEESLAAGLAGSSGSMITKALRRTCRGAERVDDAFCMEVLPPSGAKAPQRRGKKASKLAKVLELLSMSPEG